MDTLSREECVEQAYFFRALAERMQAGVSTQDLLVMLKEEVLATTRLPMAIDFLASELRLKGVFASAMARLSHYFSPFQTFVVQRAEAERGRFDFNVAAVILQREASYRAESPTPQGVFLFQFETLARNRLGYDEGLTAIAGDGVFDENWREFILQMRHQIGMVDISDLIYLRSEHYANQQRQAGKPPPESPILFGEKEGRIALAQRRKDPLLLFAALQRHLGYPKVPRPKRRTQSRDQIPDLCRRLERLETRLRILEEEQRGGIDLSQFYTPPESEEVDHPVAD